MVVLAEFGKRLEGISGNMASRISTIKKNLQNATPNDIKILMTDAEPKHPTRSFCPHLSWHGPKRTYKTSYPSVFNPRSPGQEIRATGGRDEVLCRRVALVYRRLLFGPIGHR